MQRYLLLFIEALWGFPSSSVVKNPAMQKTQVRSLGQKDSPRGGRGTHSSILARRIPWTEEPGGLRSMGLKELGMTGVTKHSTYRGLAVCHLTGKDHFDLYTGRVKAIAPALQIRKLRLQEVR